MQGSEFGVWGVECRVQGVGARSVGCGVQGLGMVYRILGSRVFDSGVRV